MAQSCVQCYTAAHHGDKDQCSSPMEEFSFEEAFATWHSTKMHRTMTAKTTEKEKAKHEAEVKEAEQEKETATPASAVPSSSSLGKGKPLHMLPPYLHQLPGDLAVQLHPWAQQQQSSSATSSSSDCCLM